MSQTTTPSGAESNSRAAFEHFMSNAGANPEAIERAFYTYKQAKSANYFHVWSYCWSVREETVAALIARNAELEAERDASDKYTWADGFPPKHHAEEWFLADTKFGPMALRKLPEEYAHDYTSADHTYVMRDAVKRWMQLPDSEFIAYASKGQIFELRAERDALAAENKALREALSIYAHEYNQHWVDGMPILEPIADAALARTPAKENAACDSAT